ncbi:DUF982 domain-containing protein [Rhizobium sp. CNPSo 4039]|uniref:DUF982 domain-containing protein n=1 Tax=Rhizobium sp. CNPSo 4039 TaxID=3021409 RepID=UPI00254CA71C|nr:DUF982 domain-containing protein [Rhizobium sp. CNPSo 4039]MDK4717277.1 DUF982 domain-containing protein [Rhizobium sp. CNPSo 4039]
MYDAKWRTPVAIDLPHPHGRQVITTVREAADCLMDIWPEPDHNPERDDALRICLEVFEGNASPDDARDAFLAAARSAGLSTS